MERALKKAILHRKNSLFYKTRNGAQMGDLFMSLIHTCELNEVNAFDYLTELQLHRGVGAEPRGMDALELPRATHSPLLVMNDFCLAEKDRLRPGRTDLSEWPPNGPPRRQNRVEFSASHENGRKCFGSACMPECPPKTSRLFRCRTALCGSTPPVVAGQSPCRSTSWAPELRPRSPRKTDGSCTAP